MFNIDNDKVTVNLRNFPVNGIARYRWVYTINEKDSKPYPTKEKAWKAAMAAFNARLIAWRYSR